MENQFLFDKRFKANKIPEFSSISRLEIVLGRNLPASYVQFLKSADGGVGPVGSKGYVDLWTISRIAETYKAPEYGGVLPHFVPIGSDGGGEILSIRFRGNEVSFGYVPFADYTEENFVEFADDFVLALRAIADGKEFQRNA